jgi:hypothetical protein
MFLAIGRNKPNGPNSGNASPFIIRLGQCPRVAAEDKNILTLTYKTKNCSPGRNYRLTLFKYIQSQRLLLPELSFSSVFFHLQIININTTTNNQRRQRKYFINNYLSHFL